MHGSAILSRYYSLRLCAVIAIYIYIYIFLFTAQGICPGNRLRLLVGQYDTGGCLVGSRPDLTISEDGIQRHGKRRSWHVQPNRVSYTIPLLNSWGTEYFCIIYTHASFASTTAIQPTLSGFASCGKFSISRRFVRKFKF